MLTIYLFLGVWSEGVYIPLYVYTQWARYESSAAYYTRGACFVNRLLLSFIFIFLYDPFKKLAQQGVYMRTLHTHPAAAVDDG